MRCKRPSTTKGRTRFRQARPESADAMMAAGIAPPDQGQIRTQDPRKLLTKIKPGRASPEHSRAFKYSGSVMTVVSPELLPRYDISGPRYTSYPTADRFVEAFTATDYLQALDHRSGGASALSQPLSVYVHVPFCESLCYYCACNKIITKHHEKWSCTPSAWASARQSRNCIWAAARPPS